MRAMWDNVIVKPLEEDVSDGGVILPSDTARDHARLGWVRSVGAGWPVTADHKVRVDVVPGDLVIYKRYGGEPIPDPGQIMELEDGMEALPGSGDVVILPREDILAVITDE